MAFSEWSKPARATTHASSVPRGTASGTWTLTGAASGVVRRISEWSTPVSATTLVSRGEGSASGRLAWAGAAVGQRTEQQVRAGSTAGGFALAGSSLGRKAPKAVAVGGLHLSGASAGTKSPKGSAEGGLSYTGRLKVRRRRCRLCRAVMSAVGTVTGFVRAFIGFARRSLARLVAGPGLEQPLPD
ncbi:MAG: hypothetical protein ACRDPJ_20280 [Nocardioidaceae bacterium]